MYNYLNKRKDKNHKMGETFVNHILIMVSVQKYIKNKHNLTTKDK